MLPIDGSHNERDKSTLADKILLMCCGVLKFFHFLHCYLTSVVPYSSMMILSLFRFSVQVIVSIMFEVLFYPFFEAFFTFLQFTLCS